MVGKGEIEQTLQLARNEVELDIARYRVWTFALVLVATSVIHFVVGASSWAVPLYFAGCVIYSVLLRAWVRRVGARLSVVVLSVSIDLAISGGIFVVTALGSAEDSARAPSFAIFILGPSLLLIILVNSLRSTRIGSIIAASGAIVVYLTVLRVLGATNPAMIAVATILLIAGGIGHLAAGQARTNLDRFARLSLLRRYLPEAAVLRVMTDDPDAATALGGRLLTVTLLAADLRGFTAFSEKLEPAEVVRQLNAYHGAMIEVIDRHGGAIDKFIGDGTLVVFGFDKAPGEGANAAVACARDMLVALEQLNVERARQDLPPLKMGVGIHTGPVIAGNIGAPGRRLEFTVIGDAVNTAARLEGMTKELITPVVISGATVAELLTKDGLRELAPVSVRGKERTISVFGLSEE